MKQPHAPQSPHFGASGGQFGGGEGGVEDDIGAIAWLCCTIVRWLKKNDELAAEIRDAELGRRTRRRTPTADATARR